MDFEHARFNMIEQQIRPWDVLDQDVLDLLFVVRREEYVPELYRRLAFTDMEIPLLVGGQPSGEVMLAPKVEARLLQTASVHRHENVLEIGAGSGYMAALLAHRARHVITCDIRPDLAQLATDNLKKAGTMNVAVESGNGLELAADSRYDVIMLSGSVPFVPEPLLQQLNPGGRLVAIVGELPMMVAQVVTRIDERQLSTESLFDTVTRPLIRFPQKEKFYF